MTLPADTESMLDKMDRYFASGTIVCAFLLWIVFESSPACWWDLGRDMCKCGHPDCTINQKPLEIPELSGEGVKMKDKAAVEEKLRRLVSGGKDKLQIITDFDRTLSKHNHNGELTKSSYCVFESIPSLPRSFVDNAQALYARFRVIEDDPNLTVEEKLPHMKEWWNLNEKLFIDIKYKEEEMQEAIVKSNVHLRDGAVEAFERLSGEGVPVLVFSAGVGDVVKALITHYKINFPNVHIISNFFKRENGFITGFQGTLIHIYNKNQHAIENSDYFKELSHRENVILMGDSLGDANMDEGVSGHGAVLKIGFLSGSVEEYLPQYLDHFDIVLCDDQTMKVFNSILNHVLH